MRITLRSISDLLNNYITVSDLKFRQIEDTLDSIKGNHLKTIQGKIENLEKSVNTNSTDIQWIKKIQWYSVTLGVSTLIGIIVSIYLTVK